MSNFFEGDSQDDYPFTWEEFDKNRESGWYEDGDEDDADDEPNESWLAVLRSHHFWLPELWRVGVFSELGWGWFGRQCETWFWFIVFLEECAFSNELSAENI